jgi:hypothetical protein
MVVNQCFVYPMRRLRVVLKDVKNFYDLRNQLMNAVENQAKAKHNAQLANAATPPQAPPRKTRKLICRSCSCYASSALIDRAYLLVLSFGESSRYTSSTPIDSH